MKFKIEWRNDYLWLSLIVLLAVAIVVTSTWAKAEAAAPPAADPCDVWKEAGGMIIYRCEDEQTGDLCYVNAMMLFCLRD